MEELALFKFYETRDVFKDEEKALLEKMKRANINLTAMEALCLYEICQYERYKTEPTCSKVAKTLGVSLPQITALNNSLFLKGLTKQAQAQKAPADRRVRILHTTRKGAEVADVVENLN